MRAGDRKRGQSVRRSIGIGLCHTLGTPVRAAKSVDPASSPVFVEHFNDRPDRHTGVVAMEQVKIDVVRAQAGQRVLQIRCDVVRGDPLAVLAVVRPFGHNHDLLTHPARCYPAPKGTLDIPVPIDVSGVKGIAPQRQNLVEQSKTGFQFVSADHDSPLDQASNRFGDAWNLTVLHGFSCLCLCVGSGCCHDSYFIVARPSPRHCMQEHPLQGSISEVASGRGPVVGGQWEGRNFQTASDFRELFYRVQPPILL